MLSRLARGSGRRAVAAASVAAPGRRGMATIEVRACCCSCCAVQSKHTSVVLRRAVCMLGRGRGRLLWGLGCLNGLIGASGVLIVRPARSPEDDE